MSKEKKRRTKKAFDPNKSRGINGMPPHKRYPNSKLIQGVWASVEEKKPGVPTICEEHERVSYKDLHRLTMKCFKLMDRLSFLLVRKEQQCESIIGHNYRLTKYIKELRKNGGDDEQ